MTATITETECTECTGFGTYISPGGSTRTCGECDGRGTVEVEEEDL